MKREKKSSTAQAVGRSGRTDCWPLPPEWDQVIPPQAVIHRHVMLGHGISFSGPEWNMDWLRGLEAFIRSVVQDEIRKANNSITGGGTPYRECTGSASQSKGEQT